MRTQEIGTEVLIQGVCADGTKCPAWKLLIVQKRDTLDELVERYSNIHGHEPVRVVLDIALNPRREP